MTATTTLTSSSTSTAAHRRQSASTKQLWKTGVTAGIAASVATVAVAGAAKAIDVPLEVSGKAIPLLAFAQVTFVAAMIGTLRVSYTHLTLPTILRV